MKKTMILGAMLLAGMVNAADPAGTVNWNEQNVWKGTKIKAGTDGAALEATTPCLVESSVLIPVHEKAEYRFSGEVRKAKGAPSALFLAGFILYDKDKKNDTAAACPRDSRNRHCSGGRSKSRRPFHQNQKRGALDGKNIPLCGIQCSPTAEQRPFS